MDEEVVTVVNAWADEQGTTVTLSLGVGMPPVWHKFNLTPDLAQDVQNLMHLTRKD